jgi:hypothetical protein
MQPEDILVEYDKDRQSAKVNKLVLFIVHVFAIFILGYAGRTLSNILFARNFGSIFTPSPEDAAIIDDISISPLVNNILGWSFLIGAWVISNRICRKKKVNAIIRFSILLYSILLFYVFSFESMTRFVPFLFPGYYVLLYFHSNIGIFITFGFQLSIGLILLLTKFSRRWWLWGNNHAV